MLWLLLLPTAAPPTLYPVEVRLPQVTTVHDEEIVSGKVAPAAKITVIAERSGAITKGFGTVPRSVAKGALLVQLDDREARLELRLAEAELARATAANKAAAPAQAEQTRAEVQVAQAKLELAKLRLEQTQVRAGRAGRFTPQATEGQMVRGGETVLGTLEVDGPQLFTAQVDEKVYQQTFLPLREGKSPLKDKAKEVFLRQGDRFYPARITFIDDRFTINTRTYRVMAELLRPEPTLSIGGDTSLWVRRHPGFQTTLAFGTQYELKQNVGVGARGSDAREFEVDFDNGLLYVLDARGRVQRRTVKADHRGAPDNRRHYIREGLEPGDRVIEGRGRFPVEFGRDRGVGYTRDPIIGRAYAPVDVSAIRPIRRPDWDNWGKTSR
jgi:multidrug efflux pump subunit AcrA (membrane-fusion protein)